MAHIQISGGESPHTLRLVVDGVDLSNHIYADGLKLVRVGPDRSPLEQVWGVQMILAPDVLDIDLPEALVRATRECAACGHRAEPTGGVS